LFLKIIVFIKKKSAIALYFIVNEGSSLTIVNEELSLTIINETTNYTKTVAFERLFLKKVVGELKFLDIFFKTAQ